MKLLEDKFKKTEYHLYNFKDIDKLNQVADIKIKKLLNDVSVGGGDMFGEKGTPTNAFNSNVENDVIRREELEIDKQLSLLNRKKRELITEKVKLEDAFKCLSDDEYKLVELRYFSRNKKTWTSVAIDMGFDEGYCKKLRPKIIKTLIDVLY